MENEEEIIDMEERINALGVALQKMQREITGNIISGKMPTKEELDFQKALTYQYREMVKVQRSLKKINKVGEINVEQYKLKMDEILKKKSTMGDIVTKHQ